MKQNKLNIIIDGQFGSTGKGLLGGYLSCTANIDIFCCNLSPNAGHTYRDRSGQFIMTKQLPIGAILNKRSQIYLTAGSIINPKILLKEMEQFNIDPCRLAIHPRAAIVEQCDIDFESQKDSSVTKIASTQSGTGSALSRKILRSSTLVSGCKELQPYISELDLMYYMDNGCTCLMETSQGFDLGINSGLSYPYCTSREISIGQFLSDAQVHPKYLGDVYLTLRTYPIRVGAIKDGDNVLGTSGSFYSDSIELTWEDLGFEPELTTVTKRVRRIATFSETQFKRTLHYIKPDYIFLNFVNYIKEEKELARFYKLLKSSKAQVIIGTGPNFEDVYYINDYKNILSFTGLFN